MTTLQKLKEIQKRKTLYNICFRKAGVGLQFYDESKVEKKVWEQHTRRTARDCNIPLNKFYPSNWKEGLVVERYYPTFEEAVKAEYKKLEQKRSKGENEK